jgi:hypothetical protein
MNERDKIDYAFYLLDRIKHGFENNAFISVNEHDVNVLEWLIEQALEGDR